MKNLVFLFVCSLVLISCGKESRTTPNNKPRVDSSIDVTGEGCRLSGTDYKYTIMCEEEIITVRAEPLRQAGSFSLRRLTPQTYKIEIDANSIFVGKVWVYKKSGFYFYYNLSFIPSR